jgi:hypothetical protein
MTFFGFFKGMKYGKCEDEFDNYKKIKNHISRDKILKYLEGLSVSAVAPMSTEDIFDGEEIPQAGIYEDGNFTFPTDFCIIIKNMTLEYQKNMRNISV